MTLTLFDNIENHKSNGKHRFTDAMPHSTIDNEDGEYSNFWYSTNLSKLQLTKMLVCNNLSIGLHTLSTANFNFKLLKNEVGNCKFSNVSFCDAPYLTINDIDKKLSASLELCVDSIVVIDNINQLNYSENCILGLSDKLYQLKTLARKHEISIIGLLDTEISDSHFDDYATAIDFLERNKIFDKSIDTLIQLFRPEYYRITEYIDKSSTIGLAEILFSGRIGKGRIQLNYEPGFYKYKEIR